MVNETEIAELKGFTYALAGFSVLMFCVFLFVVVFILVKVNSIPDKDVNAVQNVLDRYQVNLN